MFLKITKQYGKPICVALYAGFAALAAKKKLLPLLILLALHTLNTSMLAVKSQKKTDFQR